LLTVGFAFVEGDECHIIASDTGGVYGSFQFYARSDDGKHFAATCNDIYSGERGNDLEFQTLCDYVAKRPLPKMSPKDWLDYAFESAKQGGAFLPSYNYESVADYVRKNPDNVFSLYFAYACNRLTCIEAYKRAKRFHQTRNGAGAAIISINAPKHMQKELLGRL